VQEEAGASCQDQDRGNEMKMTLREAEILCLIAQGFTNTEIGHKLHVTYKTVSNHLTSIIEKTGIENRMLLAFYALKMGHVTQETIDNAIDNARGIMR